MQQEHLAAGPGFGDLEGGDVVRLGGDDGAAREPFALTAAIHHRATGDRAEKVGRSHAPLLSAAPTYREVLASVSFLEQAAGVCQLLIAGSHAARRECPGGAF